jgi:tetratricopeptide (TPR) repeat protein
MTPPSPAAARRPRSAWKIGAVALALLLALGLGWRAHDRRSQVQAYVPARPAGAVLSPALAERLTAAESRARGWWQPAAGIAELGRLYHANGHAAEAAWCYTGAREVAPTEALWPHLLASLLAGAGRLEEALPLWREAVRLDPDYEPARLRLGDVLLKSNQAAEAARVYEAVLARTAHQPYALLGLARCRLSAGDWAGCPRAAGPRPAAAPGLCRRPHAPRHGARALRRRRPGEGGSRRDRHAGVPRSARSMARCLAR